MILAAAVLSADGLSGDSVADIRFRKSFPEGAQAYEALLSGSFYGNLFSTLDLVTSCLQLPKEIIKIFWLAVEDSVDLSTDPIPEFWLFRIVGSLCPFPVWFWLYHRQSVFQANAVTDLL